jgi:hypothetical protein
MAYISELILPNDRYMIGLVAHSTSYVAGEYREHDLFSSYSADQISWRPEDLRHGDNVKCFKDFGEMYAWMKPRANTFIEAGLVYEFRVLAVRCLHNRDASGVRIMDVGALVSGEEFYLLIGRQSVPPGIDEILFEDSRRLLRSVPNLPTIKDELGIAINDANEVYRSAEFDIKDYLPTQIPDGGAYIMRVHTPGETRYLGALLDVHGQISHYVLVSSATSALKFVTRKELVNAYFNNARPIARGKVGNSSLYSYLKEYTVSIEAYDPLTGRTVRPVKVLSNKEMIAFDMALSAEMVCLNLLAQRRNILRLSTIAGRKLMGLDIDKTVNLLDSILHRPNIDQPDYECYAVQFRFPHQKRIYTWCRGNTFSSQDIHFLANTHACRKFKNVNREMLVSLVQSPTLRDNVFGSLCPDTCVRILVLGPSSPKIRNIGIWQRLTHDGYSKVQSVAYIAQPPAASSSRTDLRRLIRDPLASS